jgi:hypothetical protein
MSKFLLTVAAVAALSTAAYARDADLRDLHPEWFTESNSIVIESAPMAVQFGISASERVKITQERDEGGR